MNGKKVPGISALMLGMALCMPRAWSHGGGHEGQPALERPLHDDDGDGLASASA